nr:T9SS type A sorting domain-containing protein [candidate division Zixibacteria bacterium]
MRYIKYAVIAVSLLLVGTVGLSWAQMSGVSYSLTGGVPVGGGGLSGSTNYNLCGSVPLAGGEILGSSNYNMAGGNAAIFGAGSAFNADYDGALVQTVAIGDRTLTVLHSTGAGTVSGSFFYRQGGQTSYSTAAMSVSDAQTLIYELDESLLTIRGLEYYFVITDGSDVVNIGNAAEPYTFRTQLTNEQSQRPTALPSASSIRDYRIIAMPLVPTNNTAAAVFLDDLGAVDSTQWRLGNYNPSTAQVDEYPDAARVTPGQGFWLIARGGKTYGTPGTSVSPNAEYGGNSYFSVPLDSGWNQLANPFPFNVAWSEVVFADGADTVGHISSVLEDNIYRYTGSGYQLVTVIPAWEGVFVNIKKDGIKALIRFHETSLTPKAMPPKLPEKTSDCWTANLRLDIDGLLDDYNQLGVRSDAAEGIDLYDYSEPPTVPGGPSLAFAIGDNTTGLKRTDFRPPFTDGAVWEIVVTNPAGGKLTVSGLDQIPSDMSAWLVTGTGNPIRLEEGTSVNLTAEMISARLIIGTREYVEGHENELLPARFVLEQNVPNPFNPITDISFALPDPGRVRLEIFNILGQSVRLLVDEDLPAGRHLIRWNGRDDVGTEVASGIYFYRVDYGNLSQTRKMIMIK